MDSFAEMWELVKNELKQSVTEVAYNVWLNPLGFVSFRGDTVTLSTSDFKKTIVEDKFSALIEKTFEEIIGFPVKVEFVVLSDNTNSEPKKEEEKSKPVSHEYEYTFDNFIIGPSNRFAHAAALNVANNPGKAYNPLFIYGHSGLGKTHLLSAIKHEIEMRNPSAKIIYTSGEYFTNDLVNCVRNQSNGYANNPFLEFHEKYRNCDVLLIDDIQFIAAKEATQEEFSIPLMRLTMQASRLFLPQTVRLKKCLLLKKDFAPVSNGD